MKVTKSGKTLTINGKKLVFDQRVDEAVTLEDRVIIHLRVDDFEVGDPLVGRNVIALDASGNLLWRIPATGYTVRNRLGLEVPEAFFGLELEEDHKTITIGTPDTVYEIDPESGELSNATINR